MTRCPMRTRGREAWLGEAQETTTPVAGLSPQVRWICSGVPAPPARARRVRVAALAGPAVAASRPVPPAPASTCRRDIEVRDGRELSEFPGITENVTLAGERQMASQSVTFRQPMNVAPARRAGLQAGPGLGQDLAQDPLDLVEVLLAADERRGELDHRVAAVVGPAHQAGVEQGLRQEPAQQPLRLLVVKRLPGGLILDHLDAVEVPGAADLTDDRQVVELLQGGAER